MSEQTELFITFFLILLTLEIPLIIFLLDVLFSKKEKEVLFQLWMYLPNLLLGKTSSDANKHVPMLLFRSKYSLPFIKSKKLQTFKAKEHLFNLICLALLAMNWFLVNAFVEY